MNTIACLLACLLIGIANAGVPIPCPSPPPSYSNVFASNAAEDCTFRPATPRDCARNKTGCVMALQRYGCKPSLASGDVEIFEAVFNSFEWFFSCADDTGTPYTNPTCSSECSTLSASCPASSKRNYEGATLTDTHLRNFNRTQEQIDELSTVFQAYVKEWEAQKNANSVNARMSQAERYKRTGGKSSGSPPTTPPPTTSCNNPYTPASCAVTSSASPYLTNPADWDGSESPYNPFGDGARMPEWLDFTDSGSCTFMLGYYHCTLPSSVTASYACGVAQRLAYSFLKKLSCTDGTGTYCPCSTTNTWVTTVCPFTP